MDIQATINYIQPDGRRPYSMLYKQNERPPSSNHARNYQDMTIRDARGKANMWDNGVELVEQHTSLTTEDFYANSQKIKDVYYDEMCEAVKKATGAARVIAFDHNVRNQDRARREGGDLFKNNPRLGGYAGSCHNDYTPKSAPQRILDLAKPTGQGGSYTLTDQPVLTQEEAEAYVKGRYVFINAWRNISDEPICDQHLAVCDGTSIDKDDFLEMDLCYEDRTGEIFAFSHKERHQWIYFPNMVKEEVMMLKCYDSDPTKGCQYTAHMAIKDPKAPANYHRESIEVRTIAFFPEESPPKCRL